MVFKVISEWFPHHRGIGFGLVGVISGVAGVVLSPVFQWLVNGAAGGQAPAGAAGGSAPAGGTPPPAPDPSVFAGFGRDGTYYVVALAIVVIGIPSALWFVRESTEPAVGLMVKIKSELLPRIAFKTAVKSRTFIFFAIALTLAGAAPIAIRSNAVDFYGKSGIGAATVSLSLSVLFATSVVGLLIGGILLDRGSRPWIVAVLFAAAPIGLILAAFNNGSTAALYASMAFLGVIAGVESSVAPALIAKYFGLKSFAALQGLSLAILAPSMAIAPLLISAVATSVGSYTVPFLALAVLTLVAVVLTLLLPKFPAPWPLPAPTEDAAPGQSPAVATTKVAAPGE